MYIVSMIHRDRRTGGLSVSVSKKPFGKKEDAQEEMRKLYEEELKDCNLQDNGASDDEENSCPGGYCLEGEAAIYDFCRYADYQLLDVAVYAVTEMLEGETP